MLLLAPVICDIPFVAMVFCSTLKTGVELSRLFLA